MSNKRTIREVAEMAMQAEMVCRMWEDHPHQMTNGEVSALAALIGCLTGNVAAWLIEKQEKQEGEL
ncbi:MAG: hypothetical protein XXXJIFNMEKO3_00612 [Candidatus Erwinia impunctatus]|nr:hypothetical protein XXXJIFNMEKO_00612 [Culicoides impunctatus]